MSSDDRQRLSGSGSHVGDTEDLRRSGAFCERTDTISVDRRLGCRTAGAEEPDFAFSVVPYPLLEDGSFAVINADTRLSVNADSPHREEALRFVEFFTRPENIQKFADQQASFSPLKTAVIPR